MSRLVYHSGLIDPLIDSDSAYEAASCPSNSKQSLQMAEPDDCDGVKCISPWQSTTLTASEIQ